jgi:accessory colonization factor AcfC
VPRKTEALEKKEIKQAEQNKPEVQMADQIKASDDSDTAREKKLYLEIQAKLEACINISDVNQLYIKNKVFLEALHKRNPKRARHFKDLFLKHESKFTGA